MSFDKYDGVFDYEELEINIEAGNNTKDPDIDLRPGKLCNYKCLSCNTVWLYEIEKEVLANNPRRRMVLGYYYN